MVSLSYSIKNKTSIMKRFTFIIIGLFIIHGCITAQKGFTGFEVPVSFGSAQSFGFVVHGNQYITDEHPHKITALYAGLQLGIESIHLNNEIGTDRHVDLPIGISFGYNPNTGSWSPYVSLEAGYHYYHATDRKYIANGAYFQSTINGGIEGAAKIGFTFPSKSIVAFSLFTGLDFKQFNTFQGDATKFNYVSATFGLIYQWKK